MTRPSTPAAAHQELHRFTLAVALYFVSTSLDTHPDVAINIHHRRRVGEPYKESRCWIWRIWISVPTVRSYAQTLPMIFQGGKMLYQDKLRIFLKVSLWLMMADDFKWHDFNCAVGTILLNSHECFPHHLHPYLLRLMFSSIIGKS